MEFPRKKTKEEKFEIAISKVPEVDVDKIFKMQLEVRELNYPNHQELLLKIIRSNLKQLIVDYIWENKVCSNCGINNRKLKGCALCYLSFYCGKKCQKSHWGEHKLRCKNPLTTKIVDTGPQRIFGGCNCKKCINRK